MADILQKIAGLEPLVRNILLEEIFESEKHENKTDFLTILQHADEETKETFYQFFPTEAQTYFNKEIERLEATDEEQLHIAEQNIALLFAPVEEKIPWLEKNTEPIPAQIQTFRHIMKSGFDQLLDIISDQRRGRERPPIQKEYHPHAKMMRLPQPENTMLRTPNILDCIKARKSRRKYTEEPLTLQELSYLLWATQGIRQLIEDDKISLRTVPSGGARHPFETYLAIRRVEHLTQGVYRYLPVGHQLVYLFSVDNMAEQLTEATLGQSFVGNSAVTFIWSALPYRCEWRYTTEAKKIILQDSGHLCQNLYLACESIACGTVAIGAYHQALIDKFLQVDGEDEFVVYLAPVGKISSDRK